MSTSTTQLEMNMTYATRTMIAGRNVLNLGWSIEYAAASRQVSVAAVQGYINNQTYKV